MSRLECELGPNCASFAKAKICPHTLSVAHLKGQEFMDIYLALADGIKQSVGSRFSKAAGKKVPNARP